MVVINGAFDTFRIYGTEAWMIDHCNSWYMCWDWHRTPVDVDAQDLYRSTLSDLLGGIYIIHKI